jgi:hypothetical protein
MLLDTTTHAIVGRASFQGTHTNNHRRGAKTCGRRFFSCHGSKLDLVCLQDDVDSSSQCTRECLDHKVPIQEPVDVSRFLEQSYDLNITLASPSNQDLYVRCQEAGAYKYAITISFLYEDRKLNEPIGIPCFPNTGPRKAYKYHVDKANRLLVIYCEYFLVVWKLPTTIGHGAVLQSAWRTRKDPPKGTSKKADQPCTELMKCSQERIHACKNSERQCLAICR